MRVILPLLLAAANLAPAQTIVTFTGGSGLWSQPLNLNWLLGTAPLGSLPNSSQAVSISGATVTLNVSPTIAGLTLSSSGALVVPDGFSVTIASPTGGGTLSNAGLITLNSTGAATKLRLSGVVTATGGGVITLSDNPGNAIDGISAGSEFINQNNTIQGAGHLGAGTLTLSNQGSIIATGVMPLTITPNAAGMTNSGTLRAVNGATLILNEGTFNNSGTIEAQVGSSVELRGATVAGGTLTATGHFEARTLNGTGSTLSGVTLTAGTLLEVPDANKLTLSGLITNHGTIQLSGFSAITDLAVAPTGVTLTGNGHLALTDFSLNRITGASSGTTLINDVNHVIFGAGQFGDGSLQIDNRGFINASRPGGTLVLSPGLSGTGVANSNVIAATNGGVLRLRNGVFTNSSAGSIFADFGSLLELDNATVQGGLLGGDIAVVSDSTIRNLTFDSFATLNISNHTTLTIGGAIAGSNGYVQLHAAAGGFATLRVESGGASFAGVIETNDHPNNMITGASPTALLTNSGYIRAGGQIGNGSLSLINTGLIESSTTTPLTLNVSNSGGFTNDGVLYASTGNFIVAHSFTNAGTILVDAGRTFTTQGNITHSSGSISVESGTLVATSVQGGMSSLLHGAGTISGPVTTDGVIAPGSSGSTTGVGTLAFTHSLTLQSNSLLLLDLASPTSYDQITAQSITLNGHLGVSIDAGFQGSILPSHSFTLISATSGLNGTFTNLLGGRVHTYDGLGSFQVTFAANSVTLSDFQAIPEPSTYALLALGGAALAANTWRRRRRAR